MTALSVARERPGPILPSESSGPDLQATRVLLEAAGGGRTNERLASQHLLTSRRAAVGWQMGTGPVQWHPAQSDFPDTRRTDHGAVDGATQLWRPATGGGPPKRQTWVAAALSEAEQRDWSGQGAHRG